MSSQIRYLPWKLIWKVKIPYEVAVFTWLSVKEAILTRENLQKHTYMLPMLFMSGYVEINHLFLHCKVVRQLRFLFTSFRGIRWRMLGRTGEALTGWNFENGVALRKTDGESSQQ